MRTLVGRLGSKCTAPKATSPFFSPTFWHAGQDRGLPPRIATLWSGGATILGCSGVVGSRPAKRVDGTNLLHVLIVDAGDPVGKTHLIVFTGTLRKNATVLTRPRGPHPTSRAIDRTRI